MKKDKILTESPLTRRSGPDYRVYYGQDGEALTILLCGGNERFKHRAMSCGLQIRTLA